LLLRNPKYLFPITLNLPIHPVLAMYDPHHPPQEKRINGVIFEPKSVGILLIAKYMNIGNI
jgi:hypothetical protein